MSLTGEAAAPEGYVYQTVYPHAEPPKPPLFQAKTADISQERVVLPDLHCHLAPGRPYESDYERIRSQRGTGRAIIAPAPKLPGLICQSQSPQVHHDFPNFFLKETTVQKDFRRYHGVANVIEGE